MSLVIRTLFFLFFFLPLIYEVMKSYEIPPISFLLFSLLFNGQINWRRFFFIAGNVYVRDCRVLKTSSKRVARFLLSREEGGGGEEKRRWCQFSEERTRV